MDIFFNANPEFTKWIASSGALREPFVVLDVGVLGGENPRWHFLATTSSFMASTPSKK